MIKRLKFPIFAVLATAMLVACDDKPAVPQQVLDQAKQSSEPKGPKIPTTQELLTGSRRQFDMAPLPLTLEIPSGWGKLSDNLPKDKKTIDAPQNVLQGYSPSGEVEIRFSGRPSMKTDALDRTIAFGKKEMAEKPQQILKFELRPLGSVKVLERQSVGQPAELTTYDENNQPHTRMETAFNWSETVLVPNEGGYSVYEVSFVWLTKDQYAKDKAFLNSVMSTLRYTGPGRSPSNDGSDDSAVSAAANQLRTTRLAPSPTGALHLGNARTFLINWLLARQNGWRIILRIEDIDGPRIKGGAELQAIEDLQWLGLDWDEGPIYQSTRLPRYQCAIDKLFANHAAYPCICTRKEVDAAASAPHAEDGATIYPGTCRDKFKNMAQPCSCARKPAVRFDTRNATIDFTDEFSGPHHFDVEHDLGDFVIAKGDGTPAYQLAVVVDDAEMGVTDIVRGDDLIDSTPRQILLYRALGLENRIPRYYHLPLVIGMDGRRLAKRHGDTRLATYRAVGVSGGKMLALLASWCGIEEIDDGIAARDLVGRFDLARLPRQPIVFDPSGAQL